MVEVIKEIETIKINGEPISYRAFLLKVPEYGGMSAIHVRFLEEIIPDSIIEYEDGELSIWTSPENYNELKGWKICIDKGHGGDETGAVDCVNASENDYICSVEADINLLTGRIVTELLRKKGAEVILTRKDKEAVPLTLRSDIANENNADLFVSIHYNAYSDSSARGIETYHYPGSTYGKQLAQAIHERVLAVEGFPDRGVKDARFSVLRRTIMPSVLVEYGFITNVEEEKIINTDEYRQKVSKATVEGIIEFCREHPELKKNRGNA